MGDSADKHARELQALKDAHAKHAQGMDATLGNHAPMEDRMSTWRSS